MRCCISYTAKLRLTRKHDETLRLTLLVAESAKIVWHLSVSTRYGISSGFEIIIVHCAFRRRRGTCKARTAGLALAKRILFQSTEEQKLIIHQLV